MGDNLGNAKRAAKMKAQQVQRLRKEAERKRKAEAKRAAQDRRWKHE